MYSLHLLWPQTPICNHIMSTYIWNTQFLKEVTRQLFSNSRSFLKKEKPCKRTCATCHVMMRSPLLFSTIQKLVICQLQLFLLIQSICNETLQSGTNMNAYCMLIPAAKTCYGSSHSVYVNLEIYIIYIYFTLKRVVDA